MKITLNKIRKTGLLFLCNCIAIVMCSSEVHLIAQSSDIAAKDTKAKEAADAATKAIGGAGKIGEIKSLIIKGTWNSSPTVKATGLGIEIRILLPDSFVQIRRMDMGGPSYSGVSQGTLVPPTNTKISPYSPDGSLAPPEIIEAFAKRLAVGINYGTNKAIDDWSRFLIGTLMKTGSMPVTISSGSAPGIFDLTKKDGALGEIEFDPKIGYPSVIRYKNPEYPVPGQIFNNRPQILKDGLVATDMTVARTSEDMGGGEIRFQDHFSINGIMFPRVIVSSDSADPIFGSMELRIEEVLINPKLSLKDFEAPPR